MVRKSKVKMSSREERIWHLLVGWSRGQESSPPVLLVLLPSVQAEKNKNEKRGTPTLSKSPFLRCSERAEF